MSDDDLIAKVADGRIGRAAAVADVEVGGVTVRVVRVGDALIAVEVGDLRERDRRAEVVLREAGATLARTRHRLAEAQALAKVGTFEVDPSARAVTWSPAIYEMLGVPADLDLDDPAGLGRYVHPDDLDRVRSWFWGAPPEGERREIEMRFVRPDGGVRHARAVLTTHRGADGRTLICGSTRDVTDERAAIAELEQARDRVERALGEHSRFLAAVSHELRTSAAGVIGLIELAIGADDPRADLRGASAAARHLLTVIDDLLVYARLEAGQIELDSRDFDLADVVAEAVAVVSATARGKGLSIDAWIAPELPRWRRGDPARVRELLVHLLVGAVDLTDKGGVALAIAGGDAAGALLVRIDDTGTGAPPERHVIGLAIASELAARMHGRIELGAGGSRFAVALELPEGVAQPGPVPPRRRPSASSAPPAPLAARATGRTPLRVLVADDTALVRDVVARLLVDDGQRATVVGDGDAAAAAVRRDRFDLVLMDLSMPGTDGLAATRRIRADARAHHLPRVPIVALTAWPDDEERALAAGMDDYLVKPIDAACLASLCDAVAAGAIAAPVDRAVLVERVGGSAQVAEQIGSMFVAKRDELLGGVRDACARGDADGIARAAHGVRGALAMVAAEPAMRAAAELEARATDTGARAELCARLLREIARVAADLALA